MKLGWTSDHRIVKKAIGGDRSAAECLVDSHYPGVVRFLIHLTGRVDDAEEIAQETFVRAWKSLGSYGGNSSFKTWIHSVAYREFLAHRRSAVRFETIEEAHEATGGDFGAELIDSIILQRALLSIPTDQRVALLLVHVQGLTVVEAASVLEIPKGTVMSRIATARQRLAQILSTDEKKDRRHGLSPLEGAASYEIKTLLS